MEHVALLYHVIRVSRRRHTRDSLCPWKGLVLSWPPSRPNLRCVPCVLRITGCVALTVGELQEELRIRLDGCSKSHDTALLALRVRVGCGEASGSSTINFSCGQTEHSAKVEALNGALAKAGADNVALAVRARVVGVV